MKNSTTSILVGLVILFCHEVYMFHFKFNSGFTMEFLNASTYLFLPLMLIFLIRRVVLSSRKIEVYSDFYDTVWAVASVLSLGLFFKSLLLSFGIHPGILLGAASWIISFFTITILCLANYGDDDLDKKRKEAESKRREHGIYS